ncbi:hypothetical protein WL30_21215 [Burkholderia ubonensis]|uniref:OmpA family protein n=1 Tax=Burkholderia ubonensis TaxID=101571 RepID=UPI00075BCD43|nr:OmpA family protein [Burkholderia ubonensis]KWA83083.1 hypothetical protein WL30_21215 [Burkholderia ubonensis]KWB15607.1 hypothetical protein WL31_14705 [Burkholderia ubonensis]
MDSVNILKSLESLLTEPVALQVPTFLDELRAPVVHGLDVALSNVLGAIARHNQTSAGSDSLLRVLRTTHVDSNLLTRDLSGMFTGGDATHNLVNVGKSALETLFGHKIQDFGHALAGVCGLASRNAMLLTELVTPFVLAAIKHAAMMHGPLQASSVDAVLDAQSVHLDGRVSEKLLGALGLGIGGSHIREEIRAAGIGATGAVLAAERNIFTRHRKWSWLGLLLLALLALLLLGFCVKRTPDTAQSPEAAASTPNAAAAVAQDAASAVAGVIPSGAGIIAAMMEGKPSLKVYFDYGKAELSPDFADKSKDVLAYLKDHPSSKVSVSGYTDSSGDPTLNAELAKKRAESVKANLLAAGIDASRISLEKPLAFSGATSDAKDRRVELHVQ